MKPNVAAAILGPVQYAEAEKVAAAVETLTAAEDKANAARTELHAAIVAARKAGVKPVDLVKLTGYSTEHIRQIMIKAKESDDVRS